MSCGVLRRRGAPAPFYHRLWCRECRSAYRADRIIALGIACLRAESAPLDGLSAALRAVGLSSKSNVDARLRAMRFARRVKRAFCMLVAPAVLFGGGWLWWIDRDPGIVVPASPMPRVNGFADLRDAGRMLTDAKRIGDALTSQAPQGLASEPTTEGEPDVVGPPMVSPNAPAAAPRMGAPGQAAPMMAGVAGGAGMAAAGPGLLPGAPVASGAPIAPVSATPVRHIYTIAEKAAIVAENEAALRKLREGLKLEYVQPPVRSYLALQPYLNTYRDLAGLLALDSQVKAARGDYAGAMSSCLDAIELGRRIPHGSAITGKSVGTGCEAIGREQAWSIVDRLSASEALAASRRLVDLRANYVSAADALEEEKRETMGSLLEELRRPQWRLHARSRLFDGQSYPEMDLVAFAISLPFSKSAILSSYETTMDRYIEHLRRPYPAQHWTPVPEPADPIGKLLCPVFTEVGFLDARNETQDDLLQVALGLRAYRAEHGSYPPTEAALIPRYLDNWPSDRFGANAGLNYRQRGTSYVLYSVGPDEKDDGGVPVLSPKASTTQGRYSIGSGSAGDIVAGVNRW